jgi:hypothetical protein
VLLSVIPVEEAQLDHAAGPFREVARREGVAACEFEVR